MTASSAFTILISAMFVHNVVAYFGFGNVALGENIKSSTFLWYACFMFAISTFFAATASYLVTTMLLVESNMTDFAVLFYVVFSVTPVFFSGLFIYKYSPANYFLLKDNTYLITFTAAVLGSCVYILENATNFVTLLLYILGVCMGFVLVNTILYSFSGYARRNTQGFTTYLFNVLTIAIIALILMNFATIL